ncbi:MAG: hypothetical protein ABSG59_22115 [Verrucomicrobiota bacterium]|jgi:hypothetical protein
MPTPVTPLHRWRFFRAGGFDQVKLETGADLAHLDQLDQKLWVALACPIASLEFDPKTAALIDTDQDGRIRAPELIAAVNWAVAMLKNPDDLIRAGESLALAAINDATPEGRAILAAAQQILAHLGRPNDPAVTLADAADANTVFNNAVFNGDGVIVLESASDEATRAVFTDIANCMGTVTDHSGKPGIDQPTADAFFAECAAFEAWMQAARNNPAILPCGEGTADAAAAVGAVRAKVDDFFGRCRLAVFDPRIAPLLNRKEEDYAAIVDRDLTIDVVEVTGFPLAHIAPGQPLPLEGPVNPAHAAALAAFREKAVQPLLGSRTELTDADWSALQARLEPFAAWTAAKTGGMVEKLGLARVRELLGGKARDDINALIARDKALEGQAAAATGVEKLLRFVRDLHRLCLNFVNFKNLYAGDAPAIFQAGALFLDQRSCHLCLSVEDAAKHAAMAGFGGAYLAYADCVRRGTGDKLSIVAIFSQGDDDNLMVGRNGVFYDRKGRDYDATITKILANPISLRQAFWSPYKKLVRLIEEQVSKQAATAEAEADARLAAAANLSAPPASAPPAKSAFDPSVIALLSVALGSLAAAFAAFLTYVGKFDAWQLPLVAFGVMLIISGPSLLLAYMKLHKRNLGPILDANGWAINTKARINVPFGTRLTTIAKLPPGATIDVNDRYAEKTAAWPKLLAVVLVVWWIYAFMEGTGILYRLTKDWDIPLGKPPAAAAVSRVPSK